MAVSPGGDTTPVAETVGNTTGFLFFSLALGPHPQRVLTLMPRLGSAHPRLGIAAGAVSGFPPTLAGGKGELRRDLP
jgi:hypothetical protein